MRKGSSHKPETIEKLRTQNAGKRSNTGRTHFPKGVTPWNKGKKTGITPTNKGKNNQSRYECNVCLKRFNAYAKRKYCSVKCSALERTGENNCNWIGGAWLTVRKIILVKQDYTCQVCGLREPDIMEVNHKLERSQYPELAQDENNLEVLCPNCHRRKTNLFLRNKKLQ